MEKGDSKKSDTNLPSRAEFRTPSGIEVEACYRPLGSSGHDAGDQPGFPVEYPFTRGIYPTQYRSRLWTMRQYAGYGTAVESNARFRYLLSQGQTGLSVDFDMPTLMRSGPHGWRH